MVKIQGQKPVKVLEGYAALAKELSGDTYLKTVSQKMRTALGESFENYVDAKARSRPMAYHHLYEWGATGAQGERLFKVRAMNHGSANFSLTYALLPSKKAVPSGQVFTNKAEVMENQITVTIRPTKGSVLRFEAGGREVFTTKPVVIKSPGGRATYHAMNNTFLAYFNQSAVEANPVYTTIIEQANKTITARAKAVARG